MLSLLGLDQGINDCVGAEVHIQQDGSYVLRLLKLSIRKKLLQIQSKKTKAGSLSIIAKDLGEEPLALTITGKGVLIKKTNRLDAISEQNLQHLFPAFKLAEFYVQHFPSGDHSFVAIIRREIADAIIDAFKKQGTEVLIFSLGPFVVEQVIPQLNVYGTTLIFNGHQVSLNVQKDWMEYAYNADEKSGFPLKVDIEPIPEEFLLAYATAFQLILNTRLDLIEIQSVSIRNNLTEFLARLSFKNKGSLILGLLFTLLMLNFLVFTTYNSSNEELIGKAGKQTDLLENTQKLEKDLKEKEMMVSKLGWNKGYRYAYLCDQIGLTLPKELILDEIQINPLSGAKTGLTKESQIGLGNIKIKGKTNGVYAVNNWIYELKQKSWIKDVQLEKYTADDQQQVQLFTILLKY